MDTNSNIPKFIDVITGVSPNPSDYILPCLDYVFNNFEEMNKCMLEINTNFCEQKYYAKYIIALIQIHQYRNSGRYDEKHYYSYKTYNKNFMIDAIKTFDELSSNGMLYAKIHLIELYKDFNFKRSSEYNEIKPILRKYLSLQKNVCSFNDLIYNLLTDYHYFINYENNDCKEIECIYELLLYIYKKNFEIKYLPTEKQVLSRSKFIDEHLKKYLDLTLENNHLKYAPNNSQKEYETHFNTLANSMVL